MKLKNRYFLLRHGRTIYQGRKKAFIYPSLSKNKQVPLTKKGQREIKKAAELLRNKKIDLIFCSDFLRAKETAQIVANTLRVKKIIPDKRLRDINFGVLHGKKREDFYRLFPKGDKKRFFQAPKKGESWLQCQKRMKDFLKEMEKKYKSKNILVVSHGDPLWLLEGAVEKKSKSQLLEEKKKNFIRTGELRTLETF